MVDFDDAPDVFKMVLLQDFIVFVSIKVIKTCVFKLNTASAPQFILFGRTGGKPKPADNFDMTRYIKNKKIDDFD